MHVSVRPTTGRPAIVVTPVGSGASSIDCAVPTVMVRVDVVTLPALSSASTTSVTVRPTSAADGYQRIWNGNETFRCTSWPPTLRRTSLNVAALVHGLDLDLDRVGGVHRRALAGPQPR